LPGKVVRREDEPESADIWVNEAYDGLGDTFDFYLNEFNRLSLDDRGMKLDATVHFGQNYNNAFWEGTRMVFGDGDGVVFNAFTGSVDIIGHELTHGVTQFESGLVYWDQAGALNEHLSDVFGVMVRQYVGGMSVEEADQGDGWIIGVGLLADGINGEGIRSMKNPGTAYDDPRLGGKDPQPGHMKDYVDTFSDNRGVHINSGIPNRAFYLTAMELGGFAWDIAGDIWYQTMTSNMVRRWETFQSFAQKTVVAAGAFYGLGGPEVQAVRRGWAGVGVTL